MGHCDRYDLPQFGAEGTPPYGGIRMRISHLLAGALSAGAITVIAGCGGRPQARRRLQRRRMAASVSPGCRDWVPAPRVGAGREHAVERVGRPEHQRRPECGGCGRSCSATICVYSDTTSSGGGGGGIFVEPFPGAGCRPGHPAGGDRRGAERAGTSSGGTAQAVSGWGARRSRRSTRTRATYAFVKDNYLVVLNVTSGTKSGAEMDSQVGVAAQMVAGSV